MRYCILAFVLAMALATSAAATPPPFSWKCKGGQVTAKFVKKNNASYSIRMTNNSREMAHVFVEGYAKIECNGCDQRGKIDGKRVSVYAKPGKKGEEVIAATLMKLGRLDVKHFFYACGDQQFRNTRSTRTVPLHKKSGSHKATAGSDATRCISASPAQGHIQFKNTCSDPAQIVWCHLDKKLKYEKKKNCGKDGKGRYFTQAIILKGGDTKVLKAYRPTTPIRWGACKGSKMGIAGAWNGNGGYKCK